MHHQLQKFHEWQFRRDPRTITELAEYFTFDGEDIRWYRWYRIAGCMPISLFGMLMLLVVVLGG
jgi:hypothetical protein